MSWDVLSWFMMDGEKRMGPFKWLATTLAEKMADFLLGGDVLDPRRDCSEVDWTVLENTMAQTVTAIIPRIQLELALQAADRKTGGGLDRNEMTRLIAKAPALSPDEAMVSEPGEECRIEVKGTSGADLELEMSGKGALFQTLRHEIWDRSKKINTETTNEKARTHEEAGLEKKELEEV